MVRLKRLWAAMIFVATLSAAPGLSDPPPNGLSTRAIQLNQGWSDREIEFYHFATEGTNLAPLDFVLHLPEPSKPAARFIDKLATEYGFIPAEKSALNPHGLPVGFAIDERPKYFSDRTYLGLTCSACHTRQLTYSKAKEEGADVTWTIPVHGGPALVDMQRFKRDLYDAFFALIGNDDSMLSFATGVLGHAPTDEEKAALRKEIQEFTAPVLVTRGILKKWEIPEANFGPGNLNALSQGYYNNLGMMKWLADKGHVDPSGTVPVRPRFEGTDSLVPLWFAHGDDWAQWFVEIHHPGPRNWVQSVSTSEVRPPKMVEALKAGVVLGSLHFENMAQIQHSLELLRTPKWPEEVFGPLDRDLVAQGRGVYDQNCAKCHTRSERRPNHLGVVFKSRPAFDVGTDPTAYQQFAEGGAARAEGLKKLSGQMLAIRKSQLEAKYGSKQAENYMKFESKGRPNHFALAKDEYAMCEKATWPKSGAAYWASPLEGIFASSPYFHNGSVRTLRDVLTPPDERPKTFRTGSSEFDVEGVGICSEGPFEYDTNEPGKGNGGHPFGTDLPNNEKMALIEYLKSL